MGAVFFDDGINELLSGGSPAKQTDAPLKLRHEGALDGGPGLSSLWLCSSPSNGQTPWAGEMSNIPQLSFVVTSQRSTLHK